MRFSFEPAPGCSTRITYRKIMLIPNLSIESIKNAIINGLLDIKYSKGSGTEKKLAIHRILEAAQSIKDDLEGK